MFKGLDEAIEYHEQRIAKIRGRYHSRPESQKGKNWRHEMNHRQRQHRSALESFYLTLQQVLTCLPTTGPNGGLRQEIIGYVKRLQPYADHKARGDRARLRGNSRKRRYEEVA